MKGLSFVLELLKIFNLSTKVKLIIFLLAVFLYSSVHLANASVKTDCNEVGTHKYFDRFTTLYFDYPGLDIHYDHTDEPIGKTRLQTLKQSCIDALKVSPLSGKYHFYLGLTHYALGNPSKSYQSYKKAAKLGEKRSFFAMVLLYLAHQIDVDDPKKVIEWLNESANSGYPPAQHTLAYSYYTGSLGSKGNPERALHIKVDKKKSLKWNLIAAQQGYVYSYIGVARVHLVGFGEVKPNLGKAEFWFEKAYQVGLEFNYHILAGFLYSGTMGLKKNYVQAAKWSERAALQGDAYSAYLLFEMYANGRGVELDIEKGEKWLLQAIENGFQPSLNLKTRATHFGLRLFDENDIHGDVEMRRRYKKYGTLNASSIGRKYEEGSRYTPRNYNYALYWYTKSIGDDYQYENQSKKFIGLPPITDLLEKEGLSTEVLDGLNLENLLYDLNSFDWRSTSFFRLGMMYKEGKGVSRDMRIAEEYFLEAAKHGSKDAKYELGLLYLEGNHHEIVLKGLSLLEAAAEKNDAKSLLALVRYYLDTGQNDIALEYTQRALKESFLFEELLFATSIFRSDINERDKAFKEIFYIHIFLIEKLYKDDTEKFSEVLQTLQMLQIHEIDDAFYSSMLKSNTAGEEVRRLISGIKLRSAEHEKVQSRLDYLLGKKNVYIDNNEGSLESLYAKRKYLEVETKILHEKLRSHKLFKNMTDVAPRRHEEIGVLLKENQALLNYFSYRDKTYLLVITKNLPGKLLVLDTNQSQMKKLVFDIRKSVTPAGESGHLSIPSFDLGKSYELYKKILKPAESYLLGITDLVVIADEAFRNLPLSVLIDKQTSVGKRVNYSQQSWLANRFAFSYIPSIPVFILSREHRTLKTELNSFVGFGDPLLSNERHSDLFSSLWIELNDLFRTGSVDLEALNKLPRLPNTASELETIGKLHDKKALFLQSNATEKQLKTMSTNRRLLEYDVLAFATHGLTVTQVEDFAPGYHQEPGLVLTPPKEATDLDDGLLSASEISALELDASLVILSACNTGFIKEKSASRISKLIESFIFAGAKSVLASHWYVDTNATEALITGVFKSLKNNPGLDKANALKQSMLKMIHACDWRCELGLRPNKWAHPIYWAPFTIVGE